MKSQTIQIINVGNIQQWASQVFYRGRSASAAGLIRSSPVKKSLRKSKERILLHHSAVQFSTGGPVQFSPGIYNWQLHSFKDFGLKDVKFCAVNMLKLITEAINSSKKLHQLISILLSGLFI